MENRPTPDKKKYDDLCHKFYELEKINESDLNK